MANRPTKKQVDNATKILISWKKKMPFYYAAAIIIALIIILVSSNSNKELSMSVSYTHLTLPTTPYV